MCSDILHLVPNMSHMMLKTQFRTHCRRLFVSTIVKDVLIAFISITYTPVFLAPLLLRRRKLLMTSGYDCQSLM